MNKIITTYIYPPIPVRGYDWEAIREDYDEESPRGYGKTEKEAIRDLIDQENENNN